MRIDIRLSPVVLLTLVACPVFAQDDSVKIQGIGAGEKVVVAVNARKASGDGCINGLAGDEWKVLEDADAAGLVSVGNLRRGCVLTVVAFSQKRAMLLTSLSGWKDQGGEVRAVTMKPPIEVPVVIWITHNDLVRVAYRHAQSAAQFYRENMVGFNFVPMFRNVSDDAKKVKLIEDAVETLPDDQGGGSICSNLGSLKGQAYTTKTLNVYYVNRPGLFRNCAIRQTPTDCNDFSGFPKADGNVTYLGADPDEISAKPEQPLPRLAHELGHAFGLRPVDCGGHPGKVSGFDDTNLMWGAGNIDRKKLSLGQVFRMNTQKDRWGGSMIIANKLRRDGRACHLLPWEVSTHKCPAINLGLEPQN